MGLATLAAEDLDGCEIPLRFEGEDRPYLLQKRLERTCGGEGGAAGRLRHDSQIRSIRTTHHFRQVACTLPEAARELERLTR
jgi:hypothetical protein